VTTKKTKKASALRKTGRGGQPVPGSLRGQKRRKKILAAATRLFLKGGYGATSIDAIVVSSGGSKATLYSFFPTKADLFRAVVDSIVTSNVDVELQSLDNIRDTLVMFAEKRMRVVFSRKHRALMGLIISERDRFPDIARMYYERGPLRGHTLLRDYFETLIAKGLIDIPSAEEAAQFFRGMLMHQRYIDHLYLHAQVPSEEEVGVRARHVVDRFLEAYHQPDRK